ncbi:hypothetical protein OIE73_20210 [Streptomyces hirsutus]|uniref:ApeA N-terminal domain-containing protein n=1 Tax=Streptomyces hirsutus TaxID=35620 RepID=A0ABZ1GNV8_9ACTN|nr:HEPN domain-containing protein [Streptomyces hirsutus]WSD07830.1 hypothetical protein OIE73_20210 [Streptomyces hirsutus]
MNERTWRGKWWDADRPENKIPGTLRCTEEGDLRLELIGGIDITTRIKLPAGNVYAVSEGSRDVPMIHGISNNEEFTLLSNTALHTGNQLFGNGDILKQDWSSNRALRGVHLSSLDEPIFIRGHLRLERLLHWSNRSSLEVAIKRGEEGRITERSAGVRDVEPAIAIYSDIQILLRILSRDFQREDDVVSNERSISATEAAVLTFSPKEPVSFKGFDEIAKDMQDLLTLSTYEPCGSLNRSIIYCPFGDDRAKEVEVIGRQIYRTTEKRKVRRSDFLLTIADIEFDALVSAWLSLKGNARTACNILFGLRYISQGYVGTRLLGVASAAESMHAALRSASTPIQKSEYRRLKKKLMSAIADESDELQQFVKTGLRNNPTYYDRMVDLASIPDGEATRELIPDIEAWARMLKNARNDLAHANERSSQDEETSRAFWLLEITYALLCLVLLAEMGISSEVQRAAVRRNSRISYASRQFKRVLSGSIKD